MKPTEAPSPRFLPGQTWQPWAQQQQMSGQFLPGQTWQQWAQPQNNYLAGQTWQQWAQPQRSYLAGQTWQPWAQEAMASNEVMQGINSIKIVNYDCMNLENIFTYVGGMENSEVHSNYYHLHRSLVWMHNY